MGTIDENEVMQEILNDFFETAEDFGFEVVILETPKKESIWLRVKKFIIRILRP